MLMQIYTCDKPCSSPVLLNSPVDKPPDNIVANKSRSNDSPAPFQYPIGSERHELRISPGLVVNCPWVSYPPGTDNISFFIFAVCIAPNENCDIAISSTMASS